MAGFGPLVVFEIPIPGTDIVIPITNTVTVTWFIMIIVGVTCFLLTRNFEKIPKKAQNVVELLVETIVNLTKQTMGEDKVAFAPYIGTILIFLAIANTTMAFALITFSLIQVNAIRKNGVVKRLKGFKEPMFFLTPINIIGEVATPISLGFRLFGNIMGGLIIMELFYNLLRYLSTLVVGTLDLPIFLFVIPLPLHMYFDLFSGLLQSFIFAMLTMVNVSMAME